MKVTAELADEDCHDVMEAVMLANLSQFLKIWVQMRSIGVQ